MLLLITKWSYPYTTTTAPLSFSLTFVHFHIAFIGNWTLSIVLRPWLCFVFTLQYEIQSPDGQPTDVYLLMNKSHYTTKIIIIQQSFFSYIDSFTLQYTELNIDTTMKRSPFVLPVNESVLLKRPVIITSHVLCFPKHDIRIVIFQI